MTTLRPSSACCLPTLPMVVVLPTPFTPTKSHTLGAPGSKRSVRSPVRRSALSWSLSASTRATGSVMPLLGDGGSQPVEDVARRADADVGADQGLLEVVPGLLVDRRAGQDRAHVARHRAAGPTQPLAERGLRSWWLGLRDRLRLGNRLGLGDRRGSGTATGGACSTGGAWAQAGPVGPPRPAERGARAGRWAQAAARGRCRGRAGWRRTRRRHPRAR